MKIKYTCPFWGQEGTSAKLFIEKVLNAGYDGAEINIPEDPSFENELKETLKKEDFVFIAQQWLPPANESFEDYRKRFNARLNHLLSFNPAFISSHTGKDYFSFDENSILLEDCFNLIQKTGIKIVHETHRGRFPFASHVTMDYIDRFPDIEFNADFTHWCTVAESLLEDQENAVDKAIKRSSYIHARIGHTQTPQIPNPFDDEWNTELTRFVGWWKRIIASAEKIGKKEFFICPEFGPFPYMPNKFNSTEPIANQWRLNVDMMNYLKEVLI